MSDKVLMITHTFPPVGGGAVIRIAKFVKYLPQFGWEPIVLTADLRLSTRDESLLDEVAHTRVVRTRASLFHRMRGYLVQRLTHMSVTPHTLSPNQKKDRPQERKVLYRIVQMLYRLESALLGAMLIPDQQVTWVPAAFFAARRIIKREHIQLVYTIALPNSTTFVGAFLKRFYGVKWVIDFRDVWTDRWGPDDRPARLRMWIERWMERTIVRYADRVITTTAPSRDYFIACSESSDRAKFRVITNGFDGEDFYGIKKKAEHGTIPLRFTAMTSISRNYHYEALQRFLHALQRLTKKGLLPPHAYRVEMLSSVDPNMFCTRPDDLPVHYVGFLPHRQAVEYCAGSDILFFILHSNFSNNSYPGKMFEYLALRRPMLGLTAPGMVSDFIKEHTLGWCVDDQDAEALDQTIMHIYTMWKDRQLPDLHPTVLERFERRTLTGQLADLFNDISFR